MEVLFIVFNSLRSVVGFGVFSCIGLMTAFMVLFTMSKHTENEESEKCQAAYKKLLKYFLIVLVPTILIRSLPTVDDLWKIRIGLIKYQLASPENLNKGIQAIERLAKKLECKYLGCEEDPDNK